MIDNSTHAFLTQKISKALANYVVLETRLDILDHNVDEACNIASRMRWDTSVHPIFSAPPPFSLLRQLFGGYSTDDARGTRQFVRQLEAFCEHVAGHIESMRNTHITTLKSGIDVIREALFVLSLTESTDSEIGLDWEVGQELIDRALEFCALKVYCYRSSCLLMTDTLLS